MLHQFKKNRDGALSEGFLALDAAGNLYGAADYGGSYGNGTVFKMAPNGDGSWTFSMLYDFGGSGDGTNPIPGIILDAAGNLYGTTPGGGSHDVGMVYEITP